MQSKDNLIRAGKVINEKTNATIVVSFLDEDLAPVTPTAASWTLYDASSAAVINSRNNVTLATSAGTGIITLGPSDNVMVDPTKDIEEHRVYVSFSYSGGKMGGIEIQVPVVNIKVVS